MKGARVLVKNLIRVYHLGNVEVQALRGLNMDISEGEMVSVIGPSGSGKTDGDEYVKRRQNLKQMKISLDEELHRIGVIT